MNVNNNNTLAYIPPNASTGDQIAAMNRVIDYINSQSKTQILNDGTSKRFLYGYLKGGFPGGDFGIRVAPVGVDVVSCEFKNLLYAQDFSTGNQYFNKDGKTLTLISPSSMRIAKEGFDAETATDAQLILNSAQNNLKVVRSSQVTLPASGTPVTGAVVTHNLGYVPRMFATFFNGSEYYPIPLATGPAGDYYFWELTSTEARFYAVNGSGSWATPNTVYYTLMQEPAI